jgi:hypothetical protein
MASPPAHCSAPPSPPVSPPCPALHRSTRLLGRAKPSPPAPLLCIAFPTFSASPIASIPHLTAWPRLLCRAKPSLPRTAFPASPIAPARSPLPSPAFLAPPCSPAPPIASSPRRTRFSLPAQCPASLPLRPLCALPCLLHSAASPPARGRLRPGRRVAGPLRFPDLLRFALWTRRWPQGRSGSALLPEASDGRRCTPGKAKPGRDCRAAPFDQDGATAIDGGSGARQWLTGEHSN